jgi:hypothetical protein
MIKDEAGNRRFYGVYRGVVVDNADPLNKGRLRLQVPQVLLSEETGWAWGMNQPGVSRALPALNEGVFVVFEGGDPSFPIWMGTAIASPPAPVRWSPVFQATGLTFTGSGLTYPTYESYYIKQGQLVSFNISINMSTVTNFGTGQFKTALPFAPIPTAANHFSAWSWVDPSQSADELNGHKQLVADHLPGSISLDLHWLKETTASPKPLIESLLVQGTPVTFTTASKMYINGTYLAAE